MPQRIHSPLPQTTLGRGITSERTMNTPSPRRKGFFGSLFSKYDPGNKTPTGPLFTTPFDEGKGPQIERQRRCCGLSFRALIVILIVLMIIVLLATITPILVLRDRAQSPANLSVSQCQIDFPCQNGGASVLVNTPPQCACLCAGGFSGPQCRTQDSSCVAFSSDGAKNLSIGSAIEPLIQVASTDFSNQFTLSPQRIIEQFAANNVSCTSQNSLINLNGSNAADFTSSGANGVQKIANVVIFEAWTTTTSTTTITTTFTTTIPFVTRSGSASWTTFSTTSATNTITSGILSSTYSIATSTESATPSPTGISSEGLVFGRCVILAVVQDLGVTSAASIQQLLESAIVRGVTLVHDATSGLVIDLSGETVSGLPKGG